MHISDTYCPILLPLHVPPILVLLLVDLLILLDLLLHHHHPPRCHRYPLRPLPRWRPVMAFKISTCAGRCIQGVVL